MSRRLVLALAATVVVVLPPGAAAAERSSAPPPRLGDLVVGAADIGPRSNVLYESTTKLGGVPVLMRFLQTYKGGKPVILVALALVEHDAGAAYADFAETRTELGLAGVRKHLTTFLEPGFELGKQLFGGKAGAKDVVLKKAIVGRRVAVGEKAFWVPLTLVLNKGTLRYSLAMVQTDRALTALTVLGLRGKAVAPAAVDSIVTAEQHHLDRVFTVLNTAPPTIAGTAQQGQTLTADAGAWSGSPTAFAYAWSRCDSTGSACNSIAGATSRTYVMAAADSGATLRVAVTGSNAVGSAEAQSKVTGVVS